MIKASSWWDNNLTPTQLVNINKKPAKVLASESTKVAFIAPLLKAVGTVLKGPTVTKVVSTVMKHPTIASSVAGGALGAIAGGEDNRVKGTVAGALTGGTAGTLASKYRGSTPQNLFGRR